MTRRDRRVDIRGLEDEWKISDIWWFLGILAVMVACVIGCCGHLSGAWSD